MTAKNMKGCPMCQAVKVMQDADRIAGKVIDPKELDAACPMCEIGLVMTALARQGVARQHIIEMCADAIKTFLPISEKKPIAAGLVGPDGSPLH
jgi:hypothetical protein